MSRADYGDCWVRDTAPLMGHTADGTLGALCFDFNGWGGKYEIAFDDKVSEWLTNRLGASDSSVPWSWRVAHSSPTAREPS